MEATELSEKQHFHLDAPLITELVLTLYRKTWSAYEVVARQYIKEDLQAKK